jgi:hypothetical protein
MHEDQKEQYETALEHYQADLKTLHDFLSEESGLDEIKMRILIEEEPMHYNNLAASREAWVEARKKYFDSDDFYNANRHFSS